MTGETWKRLRAAFVNHAQENGNLPEVLTIIESTHRFKTPNEWPIMNAATKELRFEENRRFAVKLPELKLNEHLTDGMKAHPEMQKGYWGMVAEAIADFVEFERLPT
jgi:hypothetical protein